MKKLVVHIGTPKTGTSSIQEFLYQNRLELLRDHSVLYPIDPSAFDPIRRRRANGGILQPEYFDKKKLQEKFDAWFSEADTVVLSEEVLFLGRNARRLPQLRSMALEVVIVADFRNGADYLSSLWTEFNRFENQVIVSPLEEFLMGRSYLAGIGTLISVADLASSFTYKFRPYMPRSRDGDSLAQFAAIIGLRKEGLPIEAQNPSMTRIEADIRQICIQEGWAYSDRINSSIIPKIAAELSTGDRRPVIETIPDEMIRVACDDHAPFLNHLMKISGNDDAFFDNSLPRCYGITRQEHQPICRSEYGKLQELISHFSNEEAVSHQLTETRAEVDQ